MGARSVVAPGRNEAVLSDLKRRFGDRLVPVRLVGDADYDSEAMKHAAQAPIDAVLDFLPPSGQSESGSYGDHDSETLSMAESC